MAFLSQDSTSVDKGLGIILYRLCQLFLNRSIQISFPSFNVDYDKIVMVNTVQMLFSFLLACPSSTCQQHEPHP
ncbi:hypothetical protein ACTXT7_001151 [Hymenolepis weldensis]